MKLYAEATFILLGLFMIIGTKCKLRILVDPPDNIFSGNSGSLIKKLFGKEGLIFLNYVFGIISLIVGIIIIFGK